MSVDRVHHTADRRPRPSQPSRRHRMRGWIVVGISLGFVALAWAWAFHRGPARSGSDVPLLAAGPQPTREKPTDPGGLKVADIDPLAYDSGRSPPRVENILPAPETPLPQPAPDPKPIAAAPVPPAATAAPAAPVQVADWAATTAPLAKPAAAAAPPAGPGAATAVAMAAPAPIPAAPMPPAPKAKPIPKAKPVVFREEAKPRVKAPETGPGGYRVQLVSLRSAADARVAEAKLRHRYGDVLSGIGVAVVPVNLGDRGTYYRLMAGPMKQGAALHLCDALRQRGAACLLAKP